MMATNQDYLLDFLSLQPDSYERWTTRDLHLAAELGKNLLERNKELENDVKQKQITIDEQTKEIEHLTKQTAALRSTNDNRIRLSEQLEVSIQELETANKRLTVDSAAIRKEMKSLSTYKDTLEARCEELQATLEKALEQQRLQKQHNRSTFPGDEKRDLTGEEKTEDLDEQLAARCEDLKKQKARDQRVIADLEAELARRIQEVALLEEEIACLQQKEAHSLTLQEELSALEEARMSQICGRCYKEMYGRPQNEVNLLMEQEDELFGNQTEAIDTDGDIKADNPYRTLVEKYGAMMEEREERERQRRLSRGMTKTISTNNTLSLQEELKLSGDFTSYHKETETKETRRGKATPTDFSEAETSSSGFSDETSAKATQTDEIVPGAFLCSIQDGEECRFSIYDTLYPIENHFRKTPGYRSLFREIFDVLKRAAEAKDDGELLPLLEDQKEPPKVPPVTPATENLPVDFEDLVSLPDSVAASDTSSIPDVTIKAEEPTSSGTKDILEFVTTRQKKKKRSSNTPTRRHKDLVDITDLVVSAEPSPVASPSRTHRRRARRSHASPAGSHVLTTMQRHRERESREGKEGSQSSAGGGGWEYQPFRSTAAQEVAKLKKLEKSYAEVLAYTPKKPFHSQRCQPPPYTMQ